MIRELTRKFGYFCHTRFKMIPGIMMTILLYQDILDFRNFIVSGTLIYPYK